MLLLFYNQCSGIDVPMKAVMSEKITGKGNDNGRSLWFMANENYKKMLL
jgi:hypothetical protein